MHMSLLICSYSVAELYKLYKFLYKNCYTRQRLSVNGFWPSTRFVIGYCRFEHPHRVEYKSLSNSTRPCVVCVWMYKSAQSEHSFLIITMTTSITSLGRPHPPLLLLLLLHYCLSSSFSSSAASNNAESDGLSSNPKVATQNLLRQQVISSSAMLKISKSPSQPPGLNAIG